MYCYEVKHLNDWNALQYLAGSRVSIESAHQSDKVSLIAVDGLEWLYGMICRTNNGCLFKMGAMYGHPKVIFSHQIRGVSMLRFFSPRFCEPGSWSSAGLAFCYNCTAGRWSEDMGVAWRSVHFWWMKLAPPKPSRNTLLFFLFRVFAVVFFIGLIAWLIWETDLSLKSLAVEAK